MCMGCFLRCSEDSAFYNTVKRNDLRSNACSGGWHARQTWGQQNGIEASEQRLM